MFMLNPLHEGRSQIYDVDRVLFSNILSADNTVNKIPERLLQGVDVLEGI